MPLETFDLTVNLCRQLGITDVSLAGGEPTIHPKFDCIVKELFDGGFRTRLITNGVTLMRRGQLENTLRYLDMCWISAYGPSEAIHEYVGVGKSVPLSEIIDVVGRVTRVGYKIGLSVLITPDSIDLIQQLLDSAESKGVRRIRLLPLQPEGRANLEMRYSWDRWPADLSALMRELRSERRAQFDVFTINSPFTQDELDSEGAASCLLSNRRLWSVTPNGDVFPCCFTAYDPDRKIGNVGEADLVPRLARWSLSSIREAPCKGVTDEFWNLNNGGRVRCPIFSVKLND